ncbi:hypothetical protein FMN50_25515 [Rhodobacterales bacterium]|nr:hypothetical protein FMN50_25515 [Rhodobacterales bacterium]
MTSIDQASKKAQAEAKEETRKILKTAEHTSTGGQLGGTFFGQEPDTGVTPPKSVSAGRS